MAKRSTDSGPEADGDALNNSPAVGDGASDSPSHGEGAGPRVVSLPQSNVFLVMTVFFVLMNVLLPWWGALASHVLLAIFIGCIVACKRNPKGYPEWFVDMQKDFSNRLRENPLEILVMIGIVALAITNNLVLGFFSAEKGAYEWVPRCREFLSILLIVGAFMLNRRRSAYKFGKRPGWGGSKKSSKSRVKVKKTVVEEPERERPPSSESQVLKADENRKRWEQRQKQRWEEWILEEVDRLNDDKRKKKPGPGA